MRPISLLATLFLAIPAVFAQNQPQPPANSAILTAPDHSEACPIDLFAQRTSPTIIVSRVDDRRRPASPRQSTLELTFKPVDASAIASVTGILYGPTFEPRVEPAATSARSDVAQRFHLERSSPTASLRRSAVTTQTMSTVRSVELTRIDFTDGSHWQASPTSQCRATPNDFLLIDATAH